MKEFINWQNDVEKTLSIDVFTSQFTENIHKLNCKSTAQISKKILNKLHNKLKINIKHMIQFEFE